MPKPPLPRPPKHHLLAAVLLMSGPLALGAQDVAPAIPLASDTPSADESPKRLFPLLQNLVADRPNLPPPYGVALMSSWIDSDWHFQTATVGIDDINVPVEIAKDCDIHIRSLTVGVKGDIWILPFFNVFGVVGKVQADNQLVLRNVPVDWDPGNGTTRSDVVVDFDLDGEYYTAGCVFAGGYRNFFGSVDLSITATDFGHTSSVTSDQDAAFSTAPRIGYATGLTQIWVGARYINASSSYTGATTLANGHRFTFDVDLDTAEWNLDLGMRTVLQKHWEVMLNSGIGDRHMIMASVGYRW